MYIESQLLEVPAVYVLPELELQLLWQASELLPDVVVQSSFYKCCNWSFLLEVLRLLVEQVR